MIRDNFSEQFGRFRSFADEALGDVPIVVGEFGIPMDLNGAKTPIRQRRLLGAVNGAGLQSARAR